MAFSRREFMAGGLAVALSPLVPASLDRALRVGAPLALLAHFGLPDNPVRVWSRSGTLRYGGFEWQGIGALGRVSTPSLNAGLGLKEVRFELSGVPPSSTTFLVDNVRNCEAQLWIAVIQKGRVVGEPWLILEALLDSQELEVGEDRLAKITLVGNVGIWSAERATNRAWTDEDQKARFPDDTGLSLMPEYVDKEIRWRQS